MLKPIVITSVCIGATILVGFVTLGYLQKNDMLPDWVYGSNTQPTYVVISEPKLKL